MWKIFWRVFMLCVLSTTLFYSQALSNEDTAQLTFSKTAVPKKNYQTYTVQKGDNLSAIILKQPSITEKDIPRYYKMTKELNPDIADLDRLYVGQTLVLPENGVAVSEEKTAASDSKFPASKASGLQTYQVKKGDSLIRIVRRKLHIKTGTQKMLLEIQSLNPNIKNLNYIYIGQIIRLPDGQTALKSVPVNATQNPAIIPEEKVSAIPAGKGLPVVEKKAIEAKESIFLPPAKRLAVIKHIITQMNGSMITSGNYYLPISKTEQLTIDCSIIPVVELDDRTTIFLDLGNRSNRHLNKMISERWSNYQLVKIDDKDDVIIILKKIFNKNKTYEITKAQKPFSLGSQPVMDVMVDWVIAKKDVNTSPSKTQGLRVVYENNALLPRAIINYARQHSLIITEISPGKGLVGKPEEIYSLPAMTILPTSSAKDFASALLSSLNIQGESDADVRVFNIAKDGFNLSIKTDIIVTRGEKKTLVFSRDLPPQFVNILQKAGNELIFISNQEDPAKNMEKILRGFNFVFTSGYFTFSGLDKNQPPYNFSFNGTKIKTDKDIYIVNFDFNPDMRGLLQETWSASILRY